MLALIRSGDKPDMLIMQKSDRLSRRDGAEAVIELREISQNWSRSFCGLMED